LQDKQAMQVQFPTPS